MPEPSIQYLLSLHAVAIRKIDGIIRKIEHDEEVKKRFSPEMVSRIETIRLLMHEQQQHLKRHNTYENL